MPLVSKQVLLQVLQTSSRINLTFISYLKKCTVQLPKKINKIQGLVNNIINVINSVEVGLCEIPEFSYPDIGNFIDPDN